MTVLDSILDTSATRSYRRPVTINVDTRQRSSPALTQNGPLDDRSRDRSRPNNRARSGPGPSLIRTGDEDSFEHIATSSLCTVIG